MQNLPVQISRFVDDGFPGWVECEFVDAEGIRQTIIDKVPIFTNAMLDATSQYPQTGIIQCSVLKQWKDERGQELARIRIAQTHFVDTPDELAEFVVFSSQLTSE